jgi:phosphatidylserine/phosphatidylglycerophosphate/cardiolipin synthase-like enzyme
VRRHRGWIGVAVVCLLVGWHLTARSSVGVGTAALPRTEPSGAAGDSLVVEPDDGMTRIDELLGSARRSLDMTMYELSDPTVESGLAGDAARGVRVRVLLDGGLERGRNTVAFEYLRSRGVGVFWSSSRYFVTHEKSFVVDRAVAVVMSLNLTPQYYATSRDVAVVDRDGRDVAAIEQVFDADIRGIGTGTPAADDLVWSPKQSGADLLALIQGARRTIDVESEELSSEPVIAALVAAARRGVTVRVVMTYQAQWAAGFSRLVTAAAQVAVLHGETPLYVHAKLLVVDAGTPHGRAFVGSENLSDASLFHDRELGIVLVAPALVARLAALIASDVPAGQPWR